jgi:restriction system protein
VQEAVAAKGFYGCGDALVVGNREFTSAAQQLADANGVELWGREVLIAKLLQVGGASGERAVSADQPPGSTKEAGAAGKRSQCVVCGATVSEKVRDYCLVRPKRFGGRIYCFTHQRSAPATVPSPD